MSWFARQQGKRERNTSGEVTTSTPANKQKMKRMESAPPALMKAKQSVPHAETTIFFMPSVDVKVMYKSLFTAVQTHNW